MRARSRIVPLVLSAAVVAGSLLLPGSAPAGSVAVRRAVPSVEAVSVEEPRAVRAVPRAEPADVPAAVVQRPVTPVAEAPSEVGVDEATSAGSDDHVAETTQTIEVLYSEKAGSGSEPRAASTGTCPKATTCTVHQLQRARWKTDSAGSLKLLWKFNDAGRRKLRAPEGLLEAAARSGMAEWRKWNSNINFVYSGTTTAVFGARGSDGSCDDGTNVIGWARMDSSIIAQVITCLDSSGGRVVDADLALNVTQHWEDIQGEPESRHTFDIRSIVTHELGHVLSLADLYARDASYMTMMGNAVYGETRKRTLGLGDIIGVQTAYKCGTGDTCSRKGVVND